MHVHLLERDAVSLGDIEHPRDDVVHEPLAWVLDAEPSQVHPPENQTKFATS